MHRLIQRYVRAETVAMLIVAWPVSYTHLRAHET